MPSTLRVVNFSPDEVKELEEEKKQVRRPMGYPSATVPANAKTNHNNETKYSCATPGYTDKTVISLYNTLSALVHATSPSALSHSATTNNTNTTFSSTYHDEYAQYLASLQAELDADTSSDDDEDDDDDDSDDMAYPYSYNVLEEPPRLAALARSREERHRVRFTHSLDRCHAWRLSTIEESRSSCCGHAAEQEVSDGDGDADQDMCDDRESSRASSDESFTTAYTTLDNSLFSEGDNSRSSSSNGSYSSGPLSNNPSEKGFWKVVMSISTKSEISLLESLGSKSTPSLQLDSSSSVVVEKQVPAGSSRSSAKKNSRHLKCLLKALKALRGGSGKS